MRPSDWIQPQHLAPDTAPARLPELPMALVIDDLLVPGRLADLQAHHRRYGSWQDAYGLHGREPHAVDRDTFLTAPDAMRFYCYREWHRPAPHDGLARPVVTHLRFLEFLSSPVFADLVRRPFALDPVELHGISSRVMTRAHFVRPHSDHGHGDRALCGIFYLHPAWRTDFGAELIFEHRGVVHAIEPRPNRLVLFEPRAGMAHHVAPFGAVDEYWERWTLVTWFGWQTAPSTVREVHETA